MKQMVEGVKQRQSIGRQSLSLSPRKREGGFSLLAPDHGRPHRPSHILLEEDDSDAHMDDEPEPEEVEELAFTAAAPKTPRMSDLRHVFARPREESSTPALAGVREMFRPQPQGPVETPRMDGMQEMLSTPAAYRAPPVVETREEEEKDEEEEVEPVEELPAKTARGKRTPATKIVRKTPVPQSAPPKSTRASSQVPDEPRTAGTVARRTRARTADGAVGQVCAFRVFREMCLSLTPYDRLRAPLEAKLRRRQRPRNPRKTTTNLSLNRHVLHVAPGPQLIHLPHPPSTPTTQTPSLRAGRVRRRLPLPQTHPRLREHLAPHAAGPARSRSRSQKRTTRTTTTLSTLSPADASPPVLP